MKEESEPPEEQGFEGAGGARKALEILALAFVFPVATYVGFVAGGWVGERVGSPGWGGVVGGLLGAVAGFVELLRHLGRGTP